VCSHDITVQHTTVLYNIVQYITEHCGSVQYSSVLCCSKLYCAFALHIQLLGAVKHNILYSVVPRNMYVLHSAGTPLQWRP